ncbi:hypothetical protein M758_UG023600 [Ceratodon purpureus]|nr:hypothetical protein M758_UG023600 [Ceratodon purpureus]
MRKMRLSRRRAVQTNVQIIPPIQAAESMQMNSGIGGASAGARTSAAKASPAAEDDEEMMSFGNMDIDTEEAIPTHVEFPFSIERTKDIAHAVVDTTVEYRADNGVDITHVLRSVNETIATSKNELDDAVVDLHRTKTKVAALEREAEISKCAVSKKIMEGEQMKKDLEDLTNAVRNLSSCTRGGIF